MIIISMSRKTSNSLGDVLRKGGDEVWLAWVTQTKL